MMFKTHLVFGIFIALLLIGLEKWYYVGLFVLSGALIPDVDFSKSKIGRKFGFVSEFIEFLFGHRKLFHSVFFALFLSLVILYFWNLNYGALFFSGYLGHLVVDGLTKEGIMMFHPLRYKIKGLMKSGGILEFLFFLIFVVFDVFLVWNTWW